MIHERDNVLARQLTRMDLATRQRRWRLGRSLAMLDCAIVEPCSADFVQHLDTYPRSFHSIAPITTSPPIVRQLQSPTSEPQIDASPVLTTLHHHQNVAVKQKARKRPHSQLSRARNRGTACSASVSITAIPAL